MKISPLTDSGTIDLNDPERGGAFGWLEEEIAADVDLRRENDERERALWGSSVLFAAKRLLQTRGYGVWWKCRSRGLIHCDNKILSRSQLVLLADKIRQGLTAVVGSLYAK